MKHTFFATLALSVSLAGANYALELRVPKVDVTEEDAWPTL